MFFKSFLGEPGNRGFEATDAVKTFSLYLQMKNLKTQEIKLLIYMVMITLIARGEPSLGFGGLAEL